MDILYIRRYEYMDIYGYIDIFNNKPPLRRHSCASQDQTRPQSRRPATAPPSACRTRTCPRRTWSSTCLFTIMSLYSVCVRVCACVCVCVCACVRACVCVCACVWGGGCSTTTTPCRCLTFLFRFQRVVTPPSCGISCATGNRCC